MLGSRDSEVAAVVRDTELISSYMAGREYKVGRFAHTLRLRLMREHLGIDVDELMAKERMADDKSHDDEWHDGTSDNTSYGRPSMDSNRSAPHSKDKSHKKSGSEADSVHIRAEVLSSFNHDVDWEQEHNPNLYNPKKATKDSRVMTEEHRKDVRGLGPDHMKAIDDLFQSKDKSAAKRPSPLDRRAGTEDKVYSSNPNQGDGGQVKPVNTAINNRDRGSSISSAKSRRSDKEYVGNLGLPPPPMMRNYTAEMSLPLFSQLPPLPITNDYDIGGPGGHRQSTTSNASTSNHPLFSELRQPIFDNDAFKDPLNDSFILETWHEIAMNNTKIYREVFRCMPDNEVKTWKEYKDYQAYADKFAVSQDGEKPSTQTGRGSGQKGSAAPGIGISINPIDKVNEKAAQAGHALHTTTSRTDDIPDNDPSEKNASINGVINEKAAMAELDTPSSRGTDTSTKVGKNDSAISSKDTLNEKEAHPRSSQTSVKQNDNLHPHASIRRRRRGNTRNSKRDFNLNEPVMDKKTAEELLCLTQGHLVVWPYDWLITEAEGGNWLYSIDQIAPLEI